MRFFTSLDAVAARISTGGLGRRRLLGLLAVMASRMPFRSRRHRARVELTPDAIAVVQKLVDEGYHNSIDEVIVAALQNMRYRIENETQNLQTAETVGACGREFCSPGNAGMVEATPDKTSKILVRATEVFGSRDPAEAWFQAPALALNQQRPKDVLNMPGGQETLENLLGQLEYCVYI